MPSSGYLRNLPFQKIRDWRGRFRNSSFMTSCQSSLTSVALGEEAVAAEVEPVAVADLGLGDAADLVLRLEHDHGHATLREQVAGGQARGAAAEHRDGPAVATLVVGGVPGRIEFNGRHVHHHARFPARVLHLLITANRP